MGRELPEGSSSLVEIKFHLAILCLIIFFCFVNVFGYLIVINLLQFYDLENKYPRFKGFINYFKKSSWFIIIMEVNLGFLGLLILIFAGFFPLFDNVF